MKKIFLLLLIIIFGLCLFISCVPTTPSEGEGEDSSPGLTTNRVVFVELFNAVGCGASKAINPIMEELAQEYGTGQVILVEEAGWGKYSTTETMERFSWYVPGTKHTPFIAFNGLNETLASVGAIGGGGTPSPPPAPTKGSIDGIIMIPEGNKSRDLSGWVPLPNATVTLTDSTGKTYTVTTDENGNYSFSQVSPGSNYIITATGEVGGNTIVLKDIVPQLEAGEEYDAGTADAESTSLALVVEDILDKGIEPDLNAIQQSTSYNTLVNEVLIILEQHNNVIADPEIKNIVFNNLDELIEPWDGWFSNTQWEIKNDQNVGPGPNNYSNSINNVWRDDQDNLHLRIIKRDNKWYCAEIYTEKEGWGYGKYEFELGPVKMRKKDANGNISEVNYLDKQIVFGLFTYDSSLFAHKSHNEIDIEFAQWNDEDIDNGNYTVWYASEQLQEVDKNNTFSFPINIGNDTLHSFEWNYNKIVFSSNGSDKIYPSNDFIYQENYIPFYWGDGKDYIPISNEESKEKVHINLYWFQGPPTEENNIEEIEVIIKNFQFEPFAVTGPVHNLTQGTYYATIQAALDDADNDNTIEVDDGTYDESIVFPYGKVIVLRSVNGASLTIIRGDDGSNTVAFDHSLEGTTLEGFTITHDDGLNGRGIYKYYGYLDIYNCTISGNTNTSGYGGGIYNAGTGTLTITDSTISGNTNTVEYSVGYVGGIFNVGTLTITDSTISGNTGSGYGGGILNYYNGTLNIIGTTISSNFSSQDAGILNVGTSTITESTISNNSATVEGGGIGNWGTLTITSSNISNNFGAYNGGAVDNCHDSTLTITGCTISNNTADICGGIHLDVQCQQIVNIGGSSENDLNNFNEFINNYKTGNAPSPDQHIRNFYGDCHMDYLYNYYTPDTQPPDTPVLDDFTYCPLSGINYDLTWSDESNSGAVSYNIQESEDSTFSNIFSVADHQTSNTYYTYNHSVTSDTVYYYRIRAKNSEGHYSSWSNIVDVMVVLFQ